MKIITIGRHPDNDIVVNDPCVGRHNCQIIDDNGVFRLRDLGSQNGTFVNGKRITGEIVLYITDVIIIGNTTLPWQNYFTESDLKKDLKKCTKGHYYNSNSEKCPYCNGRTIEQELEDLPQRPFVFPPETAMCYSQVPPRIKWVRRLLIGVIIALILNTIFYFIRK